MLVATGPDVTGLGRAPAHSSLNHIVDTRLSSCLIIHVWVASLHFRKSFLRLIALAPACVAGAFSACAAQHAAPPIFAQAPPADVDFDPTGSIWGAPLTPFELIDQPLRPTLNAADDGFYPALRRSQDDDFYDGVSNSALQLNPSGASFKRSIGYRAHGFFRGQGDATIGRSGHYVWRNPDKGLLGFYGSRMRNVSSDTKQARLGVQGEYFVGSGDWGDMSLVGIVGGERSGQVSKLASEEATASPKKSLRLFSGFDLRHYPDADWRVSAGHRYWGGAHFGAVGVQTMFLRSSDMMGIASIEARIGAGGAGVAWASVRLFMGAQPETLIALQRKAEVAGWLQEDFYIPNAPGR